MALKGEAAEAFFRGQVDAFDKARVRLQALDPELSYLDDDGLLAKVKGAQRILTLDDPTREIPQLASLLSPVEVRVGELRELHKAEAVQAWQDAERDLTSLAHTQGLPQGELTPLLASFGSLQAEIAAAASIDAAIARKARVGVVRSQVADRVVARINELARQHAQVGVTNGSAVAPAKPARQLKTVRPASLLPNRILETPEDVAHYLNELEVALLHELESGHKLRLE